MFGNAKAIVLVDADATYARVVLDRVTLKLAKANGKWALTAVRLTVSEPLVDPHWSTNRKVAELPDSAPEAEVSLLAQAARVISDAEVFLVDSYNGGHL